MEWINKTSLTDPKQQLRLRRTCLALVGGLVHLIVCILFFSENLFRLSLDEFILLFSGIWIVNLSFPILIITGKNKRFRDPSMTIAQMIWALFCIMLSIYFVNALRSLLLMFSFLILMFGGFRLNTRQFATMVLLMICSYIVVIILLSFVPTAEFHLNEELLTLGMYAFVSVAYLAVSLEYSGLRHHMRGKEDNLQEALKKAEYESLTDQTTGCRNRRYLYSILERLRDLSFMEPKYHFAVFMIDLDYFKRINDTFGHPTGDSVLIEIGRIFNKTVRSTDYFGRMGGEEFLLITPLSSEDDIKVIAERYRIYIEQAKFDNIVPGLRLTISIGATAYVYPETTKELLKRADQALYLAKKNGRNQYILL